MTLPFCPCSHVLFMTWLKLKPCLAAILCDICARPTECCKHAHTKQSADYHLENIKKSDQFFVSDKCKMLPTPSVQMIRCSVPTCPYNITNPCSNRLYWKDTSFVQFHLTNNPQRCKRFLPSGHLVARTTHWLHATLVHICRRSGLQHDSTGGN